MVLRWSGLALVAACVSGALQVPFAAAHDVSVPYSRVVVFGDSLVDNGNGTYLLSNRTWPADQAYYDGRFSNGLTWPEQLAGLLNVSHVDDYAYGSATTDNRIARGYSGYNSTLPVPDVRGQVSRYLAHVDECADADALYIVSGGSNDAFFGLSAERNVTELAHDVVRALQRDVARLQQHGARHVVVPTLSPMQSTPYARDYADAATRTNTTRFTHRVNAALRMWAHDGAANVTLVDVAALEARILDHPTRYGVHNVRDACLVGTQKLERAAGVKRHECAEPNRYFFFDLYHPTAHVHKLLAHGAAQAIGARVGA